MGGGDIDKSPETQDSQSSSLVLEVVGDCMKVSTSSCKVTVMAKLRALSSSTEGEGDTRAPITLCAAIDRSDSMKDHLPLLKETLDFMIQQLRPKDKLCLVTFDDEVRVELPLTAMTADGKLQAEQAVKRVKERGRTNLSGGLLAALEALYRIKASDASLVESVLLFTDGKANVGIRDQSTLTKATKSVLGQIDRQACVFTFGYGSEHDADLLHALAEAGNGLFYYIDSSESIPDSFCDCLGGLLSVAAQNVRLTFTASPEGTLSQPMTSYKVTEKEAKKCYEVAIHDIYSEEERCIPATICLSPNPALTDPTSVAIVTCKVEFFDVFGRRQSEGEVVFSVVRNKSVVSPLPSDAKDEIELHLMRCEVASTLGQASTMATAGKIPAAKDLLMRMKGRVRESPAAAKPLAVHLMQTVQESLEGLQDKVTYAEHGKAVMRNYAQSHWQQRSNTTPSTEGYIRAKRAKRAKVRGTPPPPPPPPPTLSAAKESYDVTSPYRSSIKSNLMAKHSLSSQSSQ